MNENEDLYNEQSCMEYGFNFHHKLHQKVFVNRRGGGGGDALHCILTFNESLVKTCLVFTHTQNLICCI